MPRILFAIAVVTVLAPGALSRAQQKEWSFPNTTSLGRATNEYRDGEFHAVINYDYSQRNHKGRWLLLDLAVASRRSRVLHKNDIRLITAGGRELPVAPQEAVIDESAAITMLLQNARIFRRPLAEYFTQRQGPPESIRFQASPPGGGTTSDEVTVDNDHVTSGPMLFRAPDGVWTTGTHRLEITTAAGTVALPIRLD